MDSVRRGCPGTVFLHVCDCIPEIGHLGIRRCGPLTRFVSGTVRSTLRYRVDSTGNASAGQAVFISADKYLDSRLPRKCSCLGAAGRQVASFVFGSIRERGRDTSGPIGCFHLKQRTVFGGATTSFIGAEYECQFESTRIARPLLLKSARIRSQHAA